jgi:hypothetical protein
MSRGSGHVMAAVANGYVKVVPSWASAVGPPVLATSPDVTLHVCPVHASYWMRNKVVPFLMVE